MFGKVLVANRGEIACRILRTCKRLGIHTVAVYSDADQNALHVEQADEAVRLGPPQVKDSYLRADAIVEAARSTGAEAVHPGYGLLSENAAFARAVRAAGIVFIGPSVNALEALGDKMKARQVAASAGVASVPGLEEPLPDDEARALQMARESAERIGFPVLVKAVGGGGGIGMQIADSADKLERALKSCSDRARAAFGDQRVYLERYIGSPRHIEVQGLADGKGRTLSLGERECSVQRRHQKIIEESPSIAPMFSGDEGAARRERFEQSAIDIFRKVGYAGAGTCEFIVDEQSRPYFLEVNARLQVEHPVTEMCTGIDLVEEQLRIAAGEALSDETVAKARTRKGHAIEARIYAEDPSRSFLPQPGKLEELAWPTAGSDLRIETGVRQGDTITPYYDPLLAKVVAHGRDRTEAIARLDAALADSKIALVGPKGPAKTNLAFVREVLASESFRSGAYDTHLAEHLLQRG